MFQFSGFAHLSVYYVFNIVGCPIRISTDQSVCADPRSFSQLITSFFASESLGIPHTLLFTSFNIYYLLMCSRLRFISLRFLSFYFYYSFTSMSMNSFVNLIPEDVEFAMAHRLSASGINNDVTSQSF